MFKNWLRLHLSVLLWITLASVATAQVFSVPVSDKVLDGRIGLQGFEASFSVREGAMVTIKREDSGIWIGIVPIIDKTEERVNVTSFEISERMNGGLPEAKDLGLSGSVRFGEVFTVKGVQIAIYRASVGKFPKVRLIDPHRAEPSELQRLY